MVNDHWRDLPAGPDVPHVVYAAIEIPKGGRNKFEYNKEFGTYVLSRVLQSPMHYPGEYGFIPRTYYDDADPLDIIVLMEEKTFTGCIIEARPVGLLLMDDSGEEDDKVLAVPANDHRFDHIRDINDVPDYTKKEIMHFFATYKDLEKDKKVIVKGWRDRKTALDAVEHSIKLYKDTFGD
ncbi:MAG: inorganic pyrophosphatase [Candidatus Methanomethylophilaceae archaeon]|nr:inorganic pyrophosphatase [Candidatus Methanomethylophilaceae archaeon]MDI3542069.1 inorganic pyrophosphatase [Candidatus Methanomethylophilaceae archaeon]HIJ00823.1 inorganic diphosphatase [Candidatus Methanomethylophilaceae archaeon]